MKKILYVFSAFILGLVLMFSLSSCGSDGEQEIGGDNLSLKSQLDALNYLNNGTVDACVIDSIMAGYYMNQDSFDDLEIVDDVELLTEQFGIAALKGSYSLIDKVNMALHALKDNNTMSLIAKDYGIESEISLEGNYVSNGATDSSWNNLVSSGKVIIGYTYYAPMAYELGKGNLVGYDVDLAKAAFAWLNETYSINLNVEFIEINWDSKEMDLASHTIDFIWNGLTITDSRLENMCISEPYLNNKQVLVINQKDHDKYTSIDSLKSATIAFEAGSSGEYAVMGDSSLVDENSIWPNLWEGFGTTLALFFITLLFAIPFGLILAFGSMSKFKPLKYLVKGFIWIIRGTPLMLQILLVTFLPLIFRLNNKDITTALDIRTVQLLFIYATIAFVINYSCYFSEIFRSGIQSIPKGQFEACKVLGLNKIQTFFKVILPQVIKRILPPMSNEIITLVKDTALAEVIGVVDLLVAANHLVNNLAVYTPLIWAAMFYLVFNGLLTILFSRIEKKLSYYEV